MIEFTKGDMFDVPVDVRVNTVNCEGVMGAGVALAFKTRYPDMFNDYVEACRKGKVSPGVLHIWKKPGEWIINFPTKRGWRDESRYEDILSGLEALRGYVARQGPISLALPALGCGHGGLDWSRVSVMIENNLANLDARILVFEPADSRNAGRVAQKQTTPDQQRALEGLGFCSLELQAWQKTSGLPATALLKGDSSVLARRWIGLLPSKKPGERELSALRGVARQLAAAADSPPVALVHATRDTEEIVELFRSHRVSVVLILPFGPLVRRTSAEVPVKDGLGFAMVSIAGPAEAWSRVVLAQSMKLFRGGASSVLLSDPAPDWLNERNIQNWDQRAVFYLRYDQLTNGAREMLERVGARPIGRRPDTGEPNLGPLFDLRHMRTGGENEGDVKGQHGLATKSSVKRELGNAEETLRTAPVSGLTWSISRDNILHSCERRYYFQYLVNARHNSKNQLHREIALLKQLQSIPSWEGDCFHVTVKHWAMAQQAGRHPSTEAMLDWLQNQMSSQWEESLSLVGRNLPGSAISCRLFEHEYGVPTTPGQLAESIGRAGSWLTSFLAWASDAGVVDAMRNAKDCWIEPDVFGPKAPGFRVDGQKVIVKVDLAVQHKSGLFEIWDWKTGKQREVNTRRIDPAALQVNVYQLWPHLSLGIPLDKIRAHVVYIAQTPVADLVHEIDADVREYVLSIVRRSVDRVVHFSGGGDLELEMEDLDYALSAGFCRYCNFKRICARSVEEEDSRANSPTGNLTLFDQRD